MKVLIVHPCKGFYGGAEEVVVQLGGYLYEKGHEVAYILKGCPPNAWNLLKGSLKHNANSYLGMQREVRSWIDWADVVNVHNFPATLMSFPTKKPLVWMCNEPAELFTNWKRKPIEAFNRWWVRRSSMKIAVADNMQAIRFQGIYGVEPTVIPYGIDYKFWSQGGRSPAMELTFGLAYGKDKKPIKLLQVGTITPYKNQLESLCTLSELVASGIDATLTLAGSWTADTGYSLKLIDYLKVADEEHPGIWKKVGWIGQVAQEGIRDLYRSHDVLLHPVKEQGGWLVPFEAMCAGLPVLTTPSFSASGLIVKHGLGAVTEDMADSITSDHLRNFDTKKIQVWVEENLTWEKFGESLVKVFEEAISAKQVQKASIKTK